jgi:hypothetical protein
VAAAAIAPAMMKGGPARLLDDFSYGIGVWKGVLSKRQLAPLLPSLAAWPPREGRRRRSWRGRWRRAEQSTP